MKRYTVYTPSAEYASIYAYSPKDACQRVYRQLSGHVRIEDIHAVAR